MSNPDLPTPPTDKTHPYAVRFDLVLGSNVELELVEGVACVPFGSVGVLSLRKVRDLPLNQTRVSLDVEAFAFAPDADRAGQLMTFSLMWLAASKRVTIGFARWTGGRPFAVRDRTCSSGIFAEASGRGFYPMKAAELSTEVARAYEKGRLPTEGLITSMQFFASAGLESSEVARFIGVMTALEALAEQQEYGAEVDAALLGLAGRIESDPTIADVAVRSSLAGQIRKLRRESVGKAIRRLVRSHIDDKEVVKFVEESYGVRSKMLHEGARASDLGARTRRLEEVLRQIYASETGLTLAR